MLLTCTCMHLRSPQSPLAQPFHPQPCRRNNTSSMSDVTSEGLKSLQLTTAKTCRLPQSLHCTKRPSHSLVAWMAWWPGWPGWPGWPQATLSSTSKTHNTDTNAPQCSWHLLCTYIPLVSVNLDTSIPHTPTHTASSKKIKPINAAKAPQAAL